MSLNQSCSISTLGTLKFHASNNWFQEKTNNTNPLLTVHDTPNAQQINKSFQFYYIY